MLGWAIFFVLLAIVISMDLGLFHRHAKVQSIRDSLFWTGIWISLALVFNIYIYYSKGLNSSIDFLTAYLIEKSLSIDNVFVFITIFHAFKIPLEDQHRVLFWGIIGAVIFRGIFISLGIILIQKFDWIFYIFGILLIYTAFKFMHQQTHEKEVVHNPLILWCQKHLKMTHTIENHKFWVFHNNKFRATPLLISLIAIEVTDIIFAIDSIPAIFAITQDPYIIFTSNIFAILGLRSLYFVIANLALKFRFLSYGLSFILVFIGLKMLLHEVFKMPSFLSLSIIGFTLSMSIIASIIVEKRVLK